MDKIKKAVSAGRFYTSKKDELSGQIDFFKHNVKPQYKYKTRAVIVPHAGYYYSGQLACDGFEYLKENLKTIFIIAPAHYVPFQGLALCDFEKWATPLGDVEVNLEINRELENKFECKYYNEAFSEEHSIEVQIPFIQAKFPDAKIVPILVGSAEIKQIRKIIAYFWNNKENGFVISSDLSHFYDSKDAVKIDCLTADMIENKDIEHFNPNQACGALGIEAIVSFAKKNGFSLIRVGLKNSGDVTGDTKRVVGYGSWIIYEGEKNEFLKKYFSDYILGICRKSIWAGFDDKKIPDLKDVPNVFYQKGACFVTLEKDRELRGCIGSIIAHRNLFDDLAQNAFSSAFADPRFEPLRRDEFDNLTISVSLLSEPEKMDFEDETDLLEQIEPFEDGIIIKDGNHQAVYLPSVWEQLPRKELFLNSLKMKAGLSTTHFSSTFEAFRFRCEYISSEKQTAE